MNVELENKLIEAFPALFAGRHEPITQNLMIFGCECNDGWYDLIRDFCFLAKLRLDSAEGVNKKKNKGTKSGEYIDYPAPTLKLVQIKEKYGTLRIYYDLIYPESVEELDAQIDIEDLRKRDGRIYEYILALSDYAMQASMRTCEITGKPGKLYTKGWHRTLCLEEAEKANYI